MVLAGCVPYNNNEFAILFRILVKSDRLLGEGFGPRKHGGADDRTRCRRADAGGMAADQVFLQRAQVFSRHPVGDVGAKAPVEAVGRLRRCGDIGLDVGPAVVQQFAGFLAERDRAPLGDSNDVVELQVATMVDPDGPAIPQPVPPTVSPSINMVG